MLILEDILYGRFVVEGVLEELILSAPMQRLKGVHQGGAIFLVDPAQQHTRFEHSLGVFWLLRNFGGSVDEQIAALLHDVSHTAFSHVGDQVFDHPGEDYHEQIFEEVIARSEIPMILEKYGYDQALKHFEDHSLLERPLPELCADRIDYTLRDLYHAGMVDLGDVRHFLTSLTVEGRQFTLSTDIAARWITTKFKKLNEQYFKKPQYLFANQRMAELLKAALLKGLITAADLQLDDEAVLTKLRSVGYENQVASISNLEGFEGFAVTGAAERVKRRELWPAVSI
ncbi:HD domain-containing protein [Mucilaginibacter daejeonensis]|uniref:HD domain-containing protein n=1 Tax=Mucilaginibacter daejeonensis TaxID=398049 RepID=UPI001D177CC8|nr:HD domain-containing protein [Mucilaginibacter daejeonensis]UEG52605.1 HD domain-containing protein [Mucilaginibacter daejeonensis]